MLNLGQLINHKLLSMAFLLLTFSVANGKPFDGLHLRKSSKHFKFYSFAADIKVLDILAMTLEGNYKRITDHLQIKFDKQVKVFIYPNLIKFHAAIPSSFNGDWFVGTAGINCISVVSPLNPGSMHTYSSILEVIVHEFVHTSINNARGKKGWTGLPKWLNEGYAYFEAGQMNDNWRATIKLELIKNPAPTWAQLEKESEVEYPSFDREGFSTLVISFLVETYGFEKMAKLIREPENIETIYGMPKSELERYWIDYLENY